MPMKYRKIFAHEDIIVPYRLRKDGVYEARVRRKDLHIEVSARDFAALKEKFIRALHKEEEPVPRGDQRSCSRKLRRVHPAMAGSEGSARKAFDIQRVRQALPQKPDPRVRAILPFADRPRQTAIVSSRLCQRGQAPHSGKTCRPSALYLRRGGGRLQNPLPDGEGRIAPLSDQEGQRAHLRGRGEAGALLPRECG